MLPVGRNKEEEEEEGPKNSTVFKSLLGSSDKYTSPTVRPSQLTWCNESACELLSSAPTIAIEWADPHCTVRRRIEG